MIARSLFLLVSLALLGPSGFARQREEQQEPLLPATWTMPALVPEITRAEIEHHVRTLASDEMQGRATGTKEAEEAARYLAAVLKGYGVQPAGGDKTFLQRVPYSKPAIVGTPTLVVRARSGPPANAVWQKDWRFPALAFAKHTLRVQTARTAADIPKEGLEEVALFLDEPARANQRDWLSSAGHRDGKGIGLVIVPTSADRLSRRMPMMSVDGELLKVFKAGDVGELTLEVKYEPQELPAYNVVGILRGEGPGAEQAVVLSAHYDHLSREGHPGGDPKDLVMNGADDDASGCSIVLELAGVLAHAKARQRTVVFLLATGEEIGLVGTNFYIEHPVVPLTSTIANLNFEMLGRPDPLIGGAGKLWLTGWGETNLGEAFAKAGIPVSVDPRPSEHFYERSDNIAFVHKGVVGQTLSTYNMHTDYHEASDEADKLDFEHLTQCARTSADAVAQVVEGKIVPAWSAKALEKLEKSRKPSGPKR